MPFKFLHAADIHLDSPLLRLGHYDDAPSELLRTATRQATTRLVDLALEEQVQFVLIAGDLYDGDWDDSRTGLFMIRQLGRLQAAGIPVFVIAGNHDAASRMTQNLPLPANVHSFSTRRGETRKLDDCRVAIHGQSFAKAAVTDNLVRQYPAAVPGYFNIGLLHTSLDGREGHANYAPCTLADLRAKGYDYWALGHIHQREVVATDPYVVYPGNLQGRHIRETGAKGALLVTADVGETPQVEFHDLDVVRWERLLIDATSADTVDELTSTTLDELTRLRRQHDGLPLAVRIEVSGDCPCAAALLARRSQWESDLRSYARHDGRDDVWIEKVRLRIEPPRVSQVEESLDGPLAEVFQRIGHYLTEPHVLEELAAELREMVDKIPDELKQVDEGGIGTREWLTSLVSGLEPLLQARLNPTSPGAGEGRR
ncbi:MAG: DNA repair exonuclease [Pirellulales bacterium]